MVSVLEQRGNKYFNVSFHLLNQCITMKKGTAKRYIEIVILY